MSVVYDHPPPLMCVSRPYPSLMELYLLPTLLPKMEITRGRVSAINTRCGRAAATTLADRRESIGEGGERPRQASVFFARRIPSRTENPQASVTTFFFFFFILCLTGAILALDLRNAATTLLQPLIGGGLSSSRF